MQQNLNSVALLLNLISPASSSPFLGFFDKSQVFSADKLLEVAVPDYKGTKDFTDVGFWNIRDFYNSDKDSLSDERIRNVGDIIYRLSMDVFGLIEVSEYGLDEMCKYILRKYGANYQFKLLDTPEVRDLAVLYDADTSQVELRNDLYRKYKDLLKARTSDGKSAFPRPPLFAECKVTEEGSESRFLMIVVHLKAFGDSQSRARRALAIKNISTIMSDIRENEEIPMILGGDFNEKINNSIFEPLSENADLFPLTADDQKSGVLSYVGKSNKSLIDHIVKSSDLQVGDIAGDDAAIIELHKSVKDYVKGVSDHLPLVVRLVYK